jgi:hypothetical protein
MILKYIRERVEVLNHTDEGNSKHTIIVPTDEYKTTRAILENNSYKIDSSEELDSDRTEIKFSVKGIKR